MENTKNKQIANNTIMLYFRQILILFVGLFSVRVVLNILGIEDYGIYTVVGGIVSLFSFLSGTMASATQRFFSFALGQGDENKLNKTFTVNWIVYLIIAITAFVLLETLGLWFLKAKLRVSPDRLSSVYFIYQFSVLSFISMIFTTPFMAIIIAHEDMNIYAYISIFEVILKLLLIYFLTYLPGDKLKLYGILVFIISIINATLYMVICLKKYQECQFKYFYWDKIVLKEVVDFTGWTLFGQITTVFRRQAITILLNQVFNPSIVVARAIASSITDRINMFSGNFNIGLYPPIIKSYAANDKNDMFSLIFNGSKITYFLMWVFALPLFIEMESILNLWLTNPPLEAVLFTRLGLIEALIHSMSLPIATAARAPGKMKLYELTLGSIQIAIFILAIIVFKLGFEAYYVYIIAIIANIIMLFVRLIIVHKLIDLPIREFFSLVFYPSITISILSLIISYSIHLLLPKGLLFSLLSIITSMFVSTFLMYFIGLDKVWKSKVKMIILRRINKFSGAK